MIVIREHEKNNTSKYLYDKTGTKHFPISGDELRNQPENKENKTAKSTSPEIDIYYGYQIPISRHIEGGCIKPDILIHNKGKKTSKIIELGVTCDSTLSVTEM